MPRTINKFKDLTHLSALDLGVSLSKTRSSIERVAKQDQVLPIAVEMVPITNCKHEQQETAHCCRKGAAQYM